MGNIAKIPSARFGAAVLRRVALPAAVLWKKSGGKTPPDPGEAIMQALVLWYDITKQQATNEGMAANPVLRDLSGNGHDATCYNFAWSRMSGIGGYGFPNLDTWIKNTAVETEIINENKVKIISGGNIKAGIRKPYSKHSIGKFRFTEITSTIYVYQSWGSISDTVLQTINEDGEYTFELEYNEDASYNQLFFAGLGTIEQLPLYPNALVSDGVDDYAQVTGLPILTKEKGYTVIAKREYIATKEGTLAHKATNSAYNTSFVCETYSNKSYYSASFGGNNVEIGNPPESIMYQTSTNYNGHLPILPGDKTDSPYLYLFTNNNRNSYSCCSLYSFLLFNRDLTEEEIEWVKENMIGYEEPPIDTSHDNIGVLLTSGTRVPYSQVPAEGYPKEQVVGITYQDGDCAFCVETDDITQSYFCGAGLIFDDPEGMLVTNANGTATTDLQGLFNTKTLCAELRADQTLAVNRCRNHQFRNGQMGYLGSLGEYHRLLAKKDVVNDLLVRCGGTPISTSDGDNYWSSTLNNYDPDSSSRIVWIWNGNGYVDGANCQNLFKCRPLCEYNPNRTDNDLDVTLVDAWIFSGHDNSEAPKEIAGEKGTALTTHNFAWNEEGSGFKDGALHFDSYDDYLDCDKTPVLTEYTLIMKRSYSKFGAYGCIASKYYNGSLNGAFLFELNYKNVENVKPNQTWNYASVGDAGAAVISQEDIPELISWQTSDSYNGKVTLKKGPLTDGVYFAIASRRGFTSEVTAMSCYWCALYSKSLTEEQIQKEIEKLEALWNSRFNNNNKETSK